MPVDRFAHPKERQHAGISKLTDFEFRVWEQYKLSADDFGVMECASWRLKADNPALAPRPEKALLYALTQIVALGILRTFTDNGRTYLYQHDWQTWQKVDYPRPTVDPKPTPDLLEKCDDVTRRLFDKHPGGKGRKSADGSGPVRRTVAEHSQESPTTRAQPREEAEANGLRLMANGYGSEGGLVETAKPIGPRDAWWGELLRRYPANRTRQSVLVQQQFNDVFARDPRPDVEVWADILDGLENALDGYEWRVKGMVPSLDKWLARKGWTERHEHAPVSTVISEKTARNLTAMEQFIKAGER